MMNGIDHCDTCIKKGWLKKQGGLVKNWLDRWFVLKGKSLFYYTKDDESRHQGTVDLLGCKLTEIAFTRDEPDRWLFEISHVARGGRANETYLLWADSEAQRSEWLSALRRAVYEDIGGGVFGGPLLQIMRYDKRIHNCDVPHVVKGCVEIILENGKEVEGIFRLSGRVSQVREMRRRYDEGQRPDLAAEFLDIHTAASLLKLYFRELPEPVIPFEYFESFLSLATSFKSHSNEEQTLKNLQSLVQQIPEENYKLLDYLTAFLHEISKHQHINKMTEKNIALIFGTNILRARDNSPEFEMATQNLTTHVVLALLEWHDAIFNRDTETMQKNEKADDVKLVSLLDEPDNCTQSTTTARPIPIFNDLDGIDFTQPNPQTDKPRVPPPIPARLSEPFNQSPNDLDSASTDSGLSKDVHSNTSTISLDSGSSINTRPTPAPRNAECVQVKKRQASVKHRNRPTGILEDEKTPSPPNRRSGSLPVTRVERAKSNFTSFIDSPLDGRISLNIGDLPSSVEDLQALVLSLKLQLKDQRTTTDKLREESENSSAKHRQQMESLARTIHQERQAKDDALARVVMLTTQLAQYQSTYGLLDAE